MRALTSPNDALFQRSSALRTDDAGNGVLVGGDVAVPSGALYLGPADGENGVDGVVVRVPAGTYRVLVTVTAGDHLRPPQVRALSIELSTAEEATRSGLPENAYWHPSPGSVPVLDLDDTLFVAADAGLRDQHRDGTYPWAGWLRDAVRPALQDARLAGHHSTEIGYPGRGETIVALIFDPPTPASTTEAAMFAGFDASGTPAKLHVTEFDRTALDGPPAADAWSSDSTFAGTTPSAADARGAEAAADGSIGAPPSTQAFPVPDPTSQPAWAPEPPTWGGIGAPPAPAGDLGLAPEAPTFGGPAPTATGFNDAPTAAFDAPTAAFDAPTAAFDAPTAAPAADPAFHDAPTAAFDTPSAPAFPFPPASDSASAFGPAVDAPTASVPTASSPPEEPAAPFWAAASARRNGDVEPGSSTTGALGPIVGGAAAVVPGEAPTPDHGPPAGNSTGAVGSFFSDDGVPAWADRDRGTHASSRSFDDVIADGAGSAWTAQDSTPHAPLWDVSDPALDDRGQQQHEQQQPSPPAPFEQQAGVATGGQDQPSAAPAADAFWSDAALPVADAPGPAPVAPSWDAPAPGTPFPAEAAPFPAEAAPFPASPTPPSAPQPMGGDTGPDAVLPMPAAPEAPTDTNPLIDDLDAGLAAVDDDDAATAVPRLGTVLVGLECGAGDLPDVANAMRDRDLTAAQLVDLVVDLQLRAGQTTDALESLRRALSSPVLSGSLAETVHLRKRLGELQLRAGSVDLAQPTLEAAQRDAGTLLREASTDQQDDTIEYARDYLAHIKFLLADSTLKLGDASRSADLASDAMRNFEELGLERMAGRAAFLAATASGEAGDDAGRLSAIRDAERVFRRGNELDGLGTALGFLGEDDALRGDYRAAIATFIEAREVLERAGEYANAAIAAHNLAICLEQVGESPAAADATRDARRLEQRAESAEVA